MAQNSATPTRKARAAVRSALRRLPAPRDRAALEVLHGMRTLVTGQAPRPEPKPQSSPTSKPEPGAEPAPLEPGPRTYGLVPGPPVPKPPALPPDTVRAEFPQMVEKSSVRSMYTAGTNPIRYDVALFEQLNKEYEDHPLVPAPRSFEPKNMAADARRRIDWTQRFIDLRDQSVLEIGCGQGYEAYVLAHDYGATVHGVDVVEYATWPQLASAELSFVFADMAEDNPFPENTFDRVVSYTVWEHVVHPRRMLQETYKVMKPGGLALIRANLYAGPKASHRYRDIYFPWPHLLFSDDVISDWYVSKGLPPRGVAWVNRLSWGHYERYIAEIGFRLRHLSFSSSPFDEEFYRRFEDVLGRFPVEDLKRDFFNVVLEKPI
ncbi:MAG TPA: methyltransferase domain-containing protein [Actinomycetes bacterium]|nr:methyltransferase domain-containing protein [Actinomycetes bacterium]